MNEVLEADFTACFDAVAWEIHQNNVEKGFWEEGMRRNAGEAIALMHSELSEALEGTRDGNPPDEKCPEFGTVETELADCIIRIMDFAAGNNLPVAQALLAKIAYNKTRPFRHGRKF